MLEIEIKQVENGYIIFKTSNDRFQVRQQWVANTTEELLDVVGRLADEANGGGLMGFGMDEQLLPEIEPEFDSNELLAIDYFQLGEDEWMGMSKKERLRKIKVAKVCKQS